MTEQSGPMTEQAKFSKSFLLVLVVVISLMFLQMIRGFLMPVFLAAIFTGLTRPAYLRVREGLGDRENLSAVVTLLMVILVIVIPLTLFAGIVASQALHITETVAPILQQQAQSPDLLAALTERFPFLERLQPYEDMLLSKVGQAAGAVGGFLLNSLANITLGTVHFFFALFVMLYSMFFFLKDGPEILDRILYLMPLSPESEALLVNRFSSVTRATLKGTLIIGVVQGGLAGAAFALAGIPGAAFWGTLMAVLSIIPGVGTALVWVPGAIYLFAQGSTTAGILLTLWCAVIVGTADNFLRPMLVGRDTEMSDLLILLSTLGGLVMFGAAGIIIGPIIAALFVTVWALYAKAFAHVLPATRGTLLDAETGSP